MSKLSQLIGIGVLAGTLAEGCQKSPAPVKITFEDAGRGTTAEKRNEMRRLLERPTGYIREDSLRRANQARVLALQAIDIQQQTAECLRRSAAVFSGPNGGTLTAIDGWNWNIFTRLQDGPFPYHATPAYMQNPTDAVNAYVVALDTRLNRLAGQRYTDYDVASVAVRDARADLENCLSRYPRDH
ncbi:MAG: hypothetical protein HY817_03800 [Candidatus Abawacabacteria bacterium]|nr:hypothetical protein [Candidatus Abawacabacteria bacterium]